MIQLSLVPAACRAAAAEYNRAAAAHIFATAECRWHERGGLVPAGSTARVEAALRDARRHAAIALLAALAPLGGPPAFGLTPCVRWDAEQARLP